MNTTKISIAIALSLFLTLSTPIFADETVPVFTPTTQGSNDDTVVVPPPTTQGTNSPEGTSGIPNTQGTNVDEGTGIIPHTQGTNSEEGEGIIPHTQGANEDETATSTATTTPVDTSVPVGGGSNQPEAARSADSSGTSGGGSSRIILNPVVTLSAPTSTDVGGSCTYINDYLNIKSDKNDPGEVTKLQEFLKNIEGMNVTVNGIFDQATLNAVKSFQAKYLSETMTPWGLQTASGIVSYTTKKKINEIYCKSIVSLTPEQLATIRSYKARLLTPPAPASEPTTTPEVEVGFVVPPKDIELPLAIETTETPATPAPEVPVITQTASVSDASPGFFQSILDALNKVF